MINNINIINLMNEVRNTFHFDAMIMLSHFKLQALSGFIN